MGSCIKELAQRSDVLGPQVRVLGPTPCGAQGTLSALCLCGSRDLVRCQRLNRSQRLDKQVPQLPRLSLWSDNFFLSFSLSLLFLLLRAAPLKGSVLCPQPCTSLFGNVGREAEQGPRWGWPSGVQRPSLRLPRPPG